jgi:putative membrane protein
MQWLYRVLQGALIGGGAILPGISGGVLCVVFGIYPPMMALLAHPVRTFRKYFSLLLPVLIGWILGFLLFARLLGFLFNNAAFANPATWLFVGLIIGTMPQLYREAGSQGRTHKSWISLVASAAIVLALLVYMQYGTRIHIAADFREISSIWWYLFCGGLWGVSLVVPGLSSSALLLFLGLYQSMTAGISAFSLIVIIPMVVGILLVVFLSARAINYMFDRHYSAAFHAVLGFVIASTIAIILPASGNTGAGGEAMGIVYTGDVGTILIWAACFIAGFLAAWLMDRLGKKLQAQKEALKACEKEME